MDQANQRPQYQAALLTGFLILGGVTGAAAAALKWWLAAPPAPPAARAVPPSESWLSDRRRQPAPARHPRARPAGAMPDFTLTHVDGHDVRLYRDGVAPAAVTEFLIGCSDCRASFAEYPELAREIRAAGETSVNVAYRGRPGAIRQAFRGVDFGGPVHIDKGSRMQRHFGIGTFTVWLLDRDGTIRHRGSPAQVRRHLAAHLTRRREQARRDRADQVSTRGTPAAR